MSEEEENHEDFGEEEEEMRKPVTVAGVALTKDMIAKGITRLERVGNGSKFAYVKLNVSQLEVNDISLLSEYNYLRYIYLSSNQISDIVPLANIKQLLALIINRNNIETFNLPKMDYLQLIDLSYNKLTTLEGLDQPRIKCLNLNYNKLSNLDTMLMDTFTNLQVLEMRSNQFTTLQGLVPLPSLTKLYLAQNKINDLTPLAKLPNLTLLHLRENEITDLTGLNELTKLTHLNLRANRIEDINQFDNLTPVAGLERLSMADNPVFEEEDLRIRLLIKMMSLRVINKDEVTPDEMNEVKDIMESQNEE